MKKEDLVQELIRTAAEAHSTGACLDAEADKQMSKDAFFGLFRETEKSKMSEEGKSITAFGAGLVGVGFSQLAGSFGSAMNIPVLEQAAVPASIAFGAIAAIGVIGTAQLIKNWVIAGKISGESVRTSAIEDAARVALSAIEYNKINPENIDTKEDAILAGREIIETSFIENGEQEEIDSLPAIDFDRFNKNCAKAQAENPALFNKELADCIKHLSSEYAPTEGASLTEATAPTE